MRGFVFSVVFIILFGTLLATIPVGLQGVGGTGLDLIPVDPSILTEFVDGANYTKSAFSEPLPDSYLYEYSLANREWLAVVDDTGAIEPDPYIVLSAKVLIVGILWLGHLDSVNFGTRGNTLSFADLDEDADDGTVKYTLQHVISGEDAGGFVAYWNTTTYADSETAWNADGLYLLHGVGLANTATTDIGALLVSLLFLQLPQVPLLVNLFIAVPIWACIIFVIWFIVKEMIPFL